MRAKRDRNDFAQWLDITLSNRGILGRTLAEQIGAHDSAVSRWRSGSSTPGMDAITEIAKALDLDALRLAVTAGHVPAEVAGVEPYPIPEPTAQRESVRRQIARIKGLSDAGREALLATYDEMVSKKEKEGSGES